MFPREFLAHVYVDQRAHAAPDDGVVRRQLVAARGNDRVVKARRGGVAVAAPVQCEACP